MKQVPQWLTTRPVAHRGLHDAQNSIPENTLAAFAAAIDAGYPIELDVQLSADHQAVVFHDRTLQRLCGSAELVSDLTVAELREHRISGTDQHLPSLAETLDFVDAQVPVLIEIKGGPQRNLRAATTSAALRDYPGEVAVQAFDPFIVAWFRRNAPEVVRGQLSGRLQDAVHLNPVSRTLMRNLGFNAVSAPDFVGYESAALSPIRARMITRRWPLLVWTVISQEDFDRVARLGGNSIFEGFIPAGQAAAE